MRQIVIDELSPMERDNIDSYLKRSLKPGPMIGLYWIVLPPDLSAKPNRAMTSTARFTWPWRWNARRFVSNCWSAASPTCTARCIAYATPMQRQFVLDFMDRMITEEMINA